MNLDFIFALYVFCMDYHSGQWSRGYRLLSRIESRYRPRLSDSAIHAIQGNRHTRRNEQVCGWDEWESSRIYYRELKRRYAGKV
jgi:hypothetical protein